jgi:phage tail protein X
MDTITVTKDGTTLSSLLARHYRRVFPGAIERVYSLNQDLALAGAYLPVGTAVTVPTLADMAATAPVSSPVVDIFA